MKDSGIFHHPHDNHHGNKEEYDIKRGKLNKILQIHCINEDENTTAHENETESEIPEKEGS